LASESLGNVDPTPAAPADTPFSFLSLTDSMLGAFDPSTIPLPPLSTEGGQLTLPLRLSRRTNVSTTGTTGDPTASIPATSTTTVAVPGGQATSAG